PEHDRPHLKPPLGRAVGRVPFPARDAGAHGRDWRSGRDRCAGRLPHRLEHGRGRNDDGTPEKDCSPLVNWGLLQSSLVVAVSSTFLAAWWGFAVALCAATLGPRGRSAVAALA